jgi:hypothetical protein
MYINLSYQTKLCIIPGDIGNSIRIHQLFLMIISWIPYLFILYMFYYTSSLFASMKDTFNPFINNFFISFSKNLSPEIKKYIDHILSIFISNANKNTDKDKDKDKDKD